MRSKIKNAILDLNIPEYGEELSEHLSRITAIDALKFASYAGISSEEYLEAKRLRFSHNKDPEAMTACNSDLKQT